MFYHTQWQNELSLKLCLTIFAKHVINTEKGSWNFPGLGCLRWPILSRVMDLLSHEGVCSFIENNIYSYFLKVGVFFGSVPPCSLRLPRVKLSTAKW